MSFFTPPMLAALDLWSTWTVADSHLGFLKIDSRRIEPGDIFFAWPGENVDGHLFCHDALQRGAKCIISQKPVPVPDGCSLFVSKFSAEETIRLLAGIWRQNFQIPLLAIGGSAGKTTTKEYARALLRTLGHQVHATEASHNGYLGIALTLLGLREHHTVGVIEIGIDQIGAMQEHVALVQPQAATIVSLGPEHMEFFLSMDAVTREELFLLDWTVHHGGKAHVNIDEPALQAWHKHHLEQPTYGLNPPASGTYDGTHLHTHGQSVALYGKHNARNFLAALSLTAPFGLPSFEQTMEHFEQPFSRSSVREEENGSLTIFDCYNAQPSSMKAGFALLHHLHQGRPGKKIAFLGDMLELGDASATYHQELIPDLLQIDVVYLFGPEMCRMSQSFKHPQLYASLTIDTLPPLPLPGDTVLIKGSRGMHLEHIYKALYGKDT